MSCVSDQIDRLLKRGFAASSSAMSRRPDETDVPDEQRELRRPFAPVDQRLLVEHEFVHQGRSIRLFSADKRSPERRRATLPLELIPVMLDPSS